MKLRTTHNSIRIRLRKSELALLEREGKVEESILFPTGLKFSFALGIKAGISQLDASMEDHQLLLSIPTEQANQWIRSSQVGIESRISLPEAEELHLLIEKDFPCLDRADEDKSDTFFELVPEQPESC